MTTRRDLLTTAPAAGALLALGPAALTAPTFARAEETAAPGPLWRSPSLVEETVTGPNGAITSRDISEVNDRLAMTEKRAIEVAPDIWLLAGWGIAHSMAVRAPEGWIIVDTGDSTRAAKEMREKLEAAVGGRVRVAAILLTHWHYADGTAAWSDDGAELWGHEWLDSNRTAGSGVGPLAGFYQARAISQFAVFHPAEGPDAFPNNLRFLPEKLMAESSYRPPARLFTNGKVETLTIAGEKVEVMPNRSDSSDSVGFYFPRKRLLISNFMVPGFIFNIYSLRGGPYRNPEAFLQGIRHMESYDAAVLLDLHAAPVTGEEAVRDAIRRSADQVRLIRDQSLRMIARGMDGRAAAEAVFMPPALRKGWEIYGQVESHVRQIYSGTVGWFGNDVYDINPLPIAEEARRTIALMGGPIAVRAAATEAAAAGDIAGWQWALKLTSLLLQRDAQDADARKTRAIAVRALGQRTTSSNARGWYITEALEIEGQLLAKGKPVTIAQVRAVLGTPRPEELAAAGTAANLAFLPVLIDPAKAGDRRLGFTLQVKGDDAVWRIEMRNGVILAEPAAEPLPDHVVLSPADLADFILGLSRPAPGTLLAALDAGLDRSVFVFLPDSPVAGLDGPDEEVHLLGEGSQ
jgi:alkyl sulfatase BDS1-like metallo-beta-lactamase superfamily hydrolase